MTPPSCEGVGKGETLLVLEVLELPPRAPLGLASGVGVPVACRDAVALPETEAVARAEGSGVALALPPPETLRAALAERAAESLGSFVGEAEALTQREAPTVAVALAALLGSGGVLGVTEAAAVPLPPALRLAAPTLGDSSAVAEALAPTEALASPLRRAVEEGQIVALGETLNAPLGLEESLPSPPLGDATREAEAGSVAVRDTMVTAGVAEDVRQALTLLLAVGDAVALGHTLAVAESLSLGEEEALRQREVLGVRVGG